MRGQGAAGAAQASSLSRGRTGGRAARGVPGSSETAISETARPCERMRSDERAERPQSVTSDLQPGDVLETSSTALQSITGQSDSTSSTCSGSTGGEAVRGAETVRRGGDGGWVERWMEEGGKGREARGEGRTQGLGPRAERRRGGGEMKGREGGACLQQVLERSRLELHDGLVAGIEGGRRAGGRVLVLADALELVEAVVAKLGGAEEEAALEDAQRRADGRRVEVAHLNGEEDRGGSREVGRAQAV